MKRFLLVYNPISGKAAFKSRLDNIIESLQRRGVLLSIYRTNKGENAEFAEIVRESRAEGIIAAGGDGTLHSVVNWLMRGKIDLPLGIIGSGTSNDFASYLGINEDVERYFDIIVEGRTREVDLGLVNKKQYFINVASAGVLTSIAHNANVRLKNSLGRMAYYIEALGEIPKFRSIKFQIHVNNVNIQCEAYLFVVLNSSTVAGMKNAAEFARVDDGRLDFIAVRACSARELVKLTRNLFAGKGITNDEIILHIQSEKFLIESEEELTGDVDGEIGCPLPIEIETIPKALEIFA